jgi:glycosyltransferase involved in cell wall biosynthesis
MAAGAPLRVGLNLLYLVGGAGGAGRYAQELMPAILEVEPETQLVAYTTTRVQGELLREPWATRVDWVRFDFVPGSLRSLATQLFRLPVEARRFDVMHSPANVGLPATFRAANVVTLLDLIWLHPETSPLPPAARARTRLLATRCARAADRVLTISEASKADLVATLRLDPQRIDVAPLAVRPEGAAATPEEELRARFALGDGPLVLCVAQKQPHKNLASLIRALPEIDDATLVLAGAGSPHEQELRRLGFDLGVSGRVRMLDWVADEDLEGLYRAARLFVLPSLIEGFGLPVIEAMRAGTPVACSNRSATLEVAGDAALLFDPLDQAEITAAVRRLLSDEDLRRDLIRRGLDRSRSYTWENTASLTLASYRRAIAAHRERRLRR